MNKEDKFKWFYAVRACVFILIVAFLFVAACYVMRLRNSNNGIYDFYSEEKFTHDAVYVGPSSARAYFAPLLSYAEYGVASYMFAMSSMPIIVMKYAVNEILKTQSPKLFIFETRSFFFADASTKDAQFRLTADAFPYSLNRISLIKNSLKFIDDADAPLSYYLDILKYHSRWNALTKTNLRYAFNTQKSDFKGFTFHSAYSKLDTPNNKYAIKYVKLSDESNEVFIDLLEYCKSKNLNALFVLSPYLETPEWRMKYNYAAEIVKGYGYELLNSNKYYNEMGIDFAADFYDGSHVNILGAVKYTRWLSEYLKENYDLEDRRGEEKYASWREDFEKWNERKEIETINVWKNIFKAQSISNYLELINNEKYSVIISAKEDASKRLNQTALDNLAKLGLKQNLAEKPNSSYIAVIDKKKVLHEILSDNPIEASGSLGNKQIYLIKSSGRKNKAISSIVINGKEYAVNSRGLNIVVYDNELGEIIDGVCFDTHIENLTAARNK